MVVGRVAWHSPGRICVAVLFAGVLDSLAGTGAGPCIVPDVTRIDAGMPLITMHLCGCLSAEVAVQSVGGLRAWTLVLATLRRLRFTQLAPGSWGNGFAHSHIVIPNPVSMGPNKGH